MGATAEEYQGFQRAVALALAKEKQRVRDQGPVRIVRYIAQFVIGGKLKKVENSDFDVFEQVVLQYSRSFPNVPIVLFSYTELK